MIMEMIGVVIPLTQSPGFEITEYHADEFSEGRWIGRLYGFSLTVMHIEVVYDTAG